MYGILNRENCVHHKRFKKAVWRMERKLSVECSAQPSSPPVTALKNHMQCNTNPPDFTKRKFLFTSSPRTERVKEYNCNLDALIIDENSDGRKYVKQRVTNKLRAHNDFHMMDRDLQVSFRK
jgi:hypothetical protein